MPLQQPTRSTPDVGHVRVHGRRMFVIAASAGGVHALITVLAALPRDFPAAIVIVLHRPRNASQLVEILQARCSLRVKRADEGEWPNGGTVYVAPTDCHLVIRPDGRFGHLHGARVRHVWSAANPLFETAGTTLGADVVGVVLTGGDSDATDGVQTIRRHGGIVIAQDRASSQCFSMPEAAIRSGAVNQVVPLAAIGPLLAALARGTACAATDPTAQQAVRWT